MGPGAVFNQRCPLEVRTLELTGSRRFGSSSGWWEESGQELMSSTLPSPESVMNLRVQSYRRVVRLERSVKMSGKMRGGVALWPEGSGE